MASAQIAEAGGEVAADTGHNPRVVEGVELAVVLLKRRAEVCCWSSLYTSPRPSPRAPADGESTSPGVRPSRDAPGRSARSEDRGLVAVVPDDVHEVGGKEVQGVLRLHKPRHQRFAVDPASRVQIADVYDRDESELVVVGVVRRELPVDEGGDTPGVDDLAVAPHAASLAVLLHVTVGHRDRTDVVAVEGRGLHRYRAAVEEHEPHRPEPRISHRRRELDEGVAGHLPREHREIEEMRQRLRASASRTFAPVLRRRTRILAMC